VLPVTDTGAKLYPKFYFFETDKPQASYFEGDFRKNSFPTYEFGTIP